MVWHEVAAIAIAAISGVVLVSALNPNAQTSQALGASFNGFAGILNAISRPIAGNA